MERLLDGKAPASAIAATITRAPGGGCPRSPGGCAPSARMRGSARSWLSPDRRLVRALPAGHGLFGPGPVLRRCLWRPLSRPSADPASPLREGPHPLRLGSPYPAPPPPRQRPRPFAGPGRLPSSSAPSPCRASCFRIQRVGSRGARHRSRCSRARGFRHRDPASGAHSPPALPREPGS